MRNATFFYFRDVGEVIRGTAEIMKSYQGMLARGAKPCHGFYKIYSILV